MYDITNPDSFAGAKSWVKELQRRGDQNVVIALVCTLLISLQVIIRLTHILCHLLLNIINSFTPSNRAHTQYAS